MVAVPGNHDVDRNSIDRIVELGLQASLKSPEDVDQLWADQAEQKRARERLRSFYAFASDHGFTTSATTFELGGTTLAALPADSAWRCSSDDDKGRLFLSIAQLEARCEALEEALEPFTTPAADNLPEYWQEDVKVARAALREAGAGEEGK